jgi:hypothetical protein
MSYGTNARVTDFVGVETECRKDVVRHSYAMTAVVAAILVLVTMIVSFVGNGVYP